MPVLIIKLSASTYIFQILNSHVYMTDTFHLLEEASQEFDIVTYKDYFIFK